MAEFKGSNSAYIVEIGNAEIDKIDIVQLNGLTMKKWYDKQENKPDYMINASLWDDGKNAIGTIWQNGELVRNEGTGYGFGINKSGGFGFGNPWDIEWNNYITGYPALIKDGKIMPDSVDGYVMNSHTKRSVIGSAGDKLYLISMNNVTVEQLKVALNNFGIYNAINLDGGGSSRLMIGDKAVNSPTDDRIIPNAIAVWLKKDNKEDNNTMKKVFLGVGHGGKDCGAVGNGKEEADINLTVALACRDELELNGVEVKLSRISDEDDPLTEEIAECNAYNPDLAIDIHTNSATGNADGFEAYYTIYGGTGKVLAENIEAEVIKAGQNSRGIKTRKSDVTGKDYYGFIRQTSCPAVICEIGFIDNKTDLADFDEQAEQVKFGKAYARGILKTLGLEIMADTQTPEKDETKHWAYANYESLKAQGVQLSEMRFDDNITRGEAFALADKIIKALCVKA